MALKWHGQSGYVGISSAVRELKKAVWEGHWASPNGLKRNFECNKSLKKRLIKKPIVYNRL